MLCGGAALRWEALGESLSIHPNSARPVDALETIMAPTTFHRVELGQAVGALANAIATMPSRLAPSTTPSQHFPRSRRTNSRELIRSTHWVTTRDWSPRRSPRTWAGPTPPPRRPPRNLGRAVLFGAVLDARSDLSDLHDRETRTGRRIAHCPSPFELSDRIHRSRAVASPLDGNTSTSSAEFDRFPDLRVFLLPMDMDPTPQRGSGRLTS